MGGILPSFPPGGPINPQQPVDAGFMKLGKRSGGSTNPERNIVDPDKHEQFIQNRPNQAGSVGVYEKQMPNPDGSIESAIYIKGNVPPVQAAMSHVAGLIFGTDSFYFDKDSGKIRFTNDQGVYDKEIHKEKMGILKEIIREVRTPNVQLNENGKMVSHKEKQEEGKGHDVIDVMYKDGKMILKSDIVYAFEIDMDRLQAMEQDKGSPLSKMRMEKMMAAMQAQDWMTHQKYMTPLSETLNNPITVFESFYTTQVVRASKAFKKYRMPKAGELGSLQDPALVKKQMEMHLLAKKTRRQAVKTMLKQDIGILSKDTLDKKMSREMRKMTLVHYEYTKYNRIGDEGTPGDSHIRMKQAGSNRVIGPSFYLEGDDPKLKKNRMRRQINAVNGYITSKKINPDNPFHEFVPKISVGEKTKMQARRAIIRRFPAGTIFTNAEDFAKAHNLDFIQGRPIEKIADAANQMSVKGAIDLCNQLADLAEKNLDPVAEAGFFLRNPQEDQTNLELLRDIDLLLKDVADNREQYQGISLMEKKIGVLEDELQELNENKTQYNLHTRKAKQQQLDALRKDNRYFTDRLLSLHHLITKAGANPRFKEPNGQPFFNTAQLLEDIDNKRIFQPGGVKVGSYILDLDLKTLHADHREIYTNQVDARKLVEQALLINAQNERNVKIMTSSIGLGALSKTQSRTYKAMLQVQRQKLNQLLNSAPQYRGASPLDRLQQQINQLSQEVFSLDFESESDDSSEIESDDGHPVHPLDPSDSDEDSDVEDSDVIDSDVIDADENLERFNLQ